MEDSRLDFIMDCCDEQWGGGGVAGVESMELISIVVLRAGTCSRQSQLKSNRQEINDKLI
jgi:hypothetical protein